MSQSVPSVISIQVGRIAPLGSEGVPSGFVKSPVTGPVVVGPLGLRGDQQADLTVHGGVDKAVYVYPSEHYASWIADVPRHEAVLVPGGFGENITIRGMDEDAASVGQVFRIGSAELQVTQPRLPCSKLALRFDDATLGRIMMQTSRTGWYMRVLRPGVIEAGDTIEILAQPNPSWTIARFARFIPVRRASLAEFAELATLEGIPESWKHAAAEALGAPGPP